MRLLLPALCLAAAGWRKYREGYRVQGRALGFLLFLILENPGLVYMGLLIGLAIGTGMTFNQRATPVDWGWDSFGIAGGGVLLGIVFYAMRYVRDRRIRQSSKPPPPSFGGGEDTVSNEY